LKRQRAEAAGGKRAPAPSEQVVLALRPKSVLRWWIVLTVVLAALSTAELFVRRAVQPSFSTSDMFFYLDTEGNLPTWVSSFGLLFDGVLAALIARARRADTTATVYWVLAAVGFSFMSADELCQYHEHLTEPIWTWLQVEHMAASGYLRNAWVVPVLLLLPLAVIAFVPFLRALSTRDRTRFIAAAAVYVFGAVVMDMISGHEYFRAGGFSMTLLALVTIEETSELLGMGLFFYAMLAYLADQHAAVQFRADHG
jgi:hypothetical protein